MNLKMHGKACSIFHSKIADDLAATHPEVVDDPNPGIVACKCSWEFNLIANVLPLFCVISWCSQKACVSHGLLL